jgi:hypothetical protein
MVFGSDEIVACFLEQLRRCIVAALVEMNDVGFGIYVQAPGSTTNGKVGGYRWRRSRWWV